jgi:predicted nucleic acid-binding protein
MDNCCFNRPYDDQASLLVQLETEAKLFVQRAIVQNTYELVWSYILDYENTANPYHNRKQAIAKWKKIAILDVDASESVVNCGKGIFLKGIKKKDALHIACAIEAMCDYFITTDDGILKKYRNGEIIVCSPIEFINIFEDLLCKQRQPL